MALTYQWYKNGSQISGATSATYSKSSAVEGDAGSYYCRVTNAFGSVNSNSATVTVNAHTLLLIQVDAAGNIVERTGNGTVTTSGTVIVDHTTTHDSYGSIRNTATESGTSASGYLDVSCDITLSDFTIEGWVYCINYGSSEYHTPLITTNKKTSLGAGAFIRGRVYDSENQINYGNDYSNGCYQLSANSTYTFVAWMHIAVVKHGTTLYLFKNGTIVDTDSNASWTYTTRIEHLYLGMGLKYDNSQVMAPNCWENIRISNVARYTANFTPPGRF